jgi:hypothetical protein
VALSLILKNLEFSLLRHHKLHKYEILHTVSEGSLNLLRLLKDFFEGEGEHYLINVYK